MSTTSDRRPDRQPGRPRPQTLYAELSAQVKEMGLLARRPGWYVGRIVAAGVLLLVLVAVHVALGDTWWQLVPAAVTAVVLTQVAFLGHDVAHRQVFAGARANEWTALLVVDLMLGMSHAWWTGKHTRHHGNPNRVGKDPDIDSAVIAYTPGAVDARRPPGRWLAGRQGWLLFPLMLLEGLALHVHGVQTVFGRHGFRRRRVEAVLLLARLGGYLGVVLLVLPPGKAAAFVGLQVALFGLYMGLAFAPNHIGMPVVPRDLSVDFLRRQVQMSRNVAGGRGVELLMGGLNLQIEHHLFPSMPRPHLHRARPVVRAFCERHDVPYAEPPLGRAYARVVRSLNEVGHGRADVFECPLVAQYRPRV